MDSFPVLVVGVWGHDLDVHDLLSPVAGDGPDRERLSVDIHDLCLFQPEVRIPPMGGCVFYVSHDLLASIGSAVGDAWDRMPLARDVRPLSLLDSRCDVLTDALAL